MREIGLEFERVRLAKAVLIKALDLCFNPKHIAEKVLKRLNGVGLGRKL